MELTPDQRELLEVARQAGFLLVHEDIYKPAKLKEQILRKSWITYKEIADSGIWDAKKSRVEAIVKSDVDPDCVDKRNHTHKVHRSEVERIAKNRNTI